MRVVAAALLLSPLIAVANCWQPQLEAGALRFTAIQAGAPLAGEFSRYGGRIQLPGTNSAGRIAVTVDTASVDTQLPELDELLRGPLFFASERWPQAHFDSDQIEVLGDSRYRASGLLRIRGIERPFHAEFTFSITNDKARLRGRTTLQRLDHDLGLEEWQDTQWVGNAVQVKVDVPLARLDAADCQNADS